MNKILLSTVAVALLSSLSYAGPKYEITPMVGKKIYNYSDDAPRFDDGEALVGVRANAYVTERVSVQLGVEASKGNKQGTGTPTADNGAETDLERGMINVQYDIPSKGKITPFINAGAGYEKLHRDEASTNVDSQAFLNVGAGLRYNVNDRVDLVAEARVIHKVEDQDDDAIGSIGVGFKFGNTCASTAPKGISTKALTLDELAALAPKKVEEQVAPVAPVVEEVEEEIVDAKVAAVRASADVEPNIVYDTSDVNVCDVNTPSSMTEEETIDADTFSDVLGYYVQVIALRKNSPDVIISRLNDKGYDYVLKGEGNLTRVLVGPYENRSAASSALKGLKKIRRDAFIYHAK